MTNELKSLGDMFDAAAKLHCSEDGCYVGTCPVNCLASLVSRHLKDNNYWMIYGDYMIAMRLSD
jgi:hypothetical protein